MSEKFLPGDHVWWMRDTQFGVQRIAAEVFCRLPKKIRVKVTALGSTFTRDVVPEKLLPRGKHEEMFETLSERHRSGLKRDFKNITNYDDKRVPKREFHE